MKLRGTIYIIIFDAVFHREIKFHYIGVVSSPPADISLKPHEHRIARSKLQILTKHYGCSTNSIGVDRHFV